MTGEPDPTGAPPSPAIPSRPSGSPPPALPLQAANLQASNPQAVNPQASAPTASARPQSDDDAESSRAEQVLSQALRLMAGGGAPNPAGGTAASTGDADAHGSVAQRFRRLTTGQLLLLAAIIGLLVGIAAGLVSLLL